MVLTLAWQKYDLGQAEPYLLYLVHFDRPVGRCSHYVGRTRQHRLAERLHEHSAGRGAALTRLACARGIGFTLANVWQVTRTHAEQTLKRAGHFRKLCPICTPGLPKPAHPLYGRSWTPETFEAHWCDFSGNWLDSLRETTPPAGEPASRKPWHP